MPYFIGDTHGNAEGLNRALFQAKLIDNHGWRTTAEMIFSIGDLINAVEDSVEGDKACLQMVKDGFIDGIIIGNHEMPYLDPSNYFSGFHYNDDVAEMLLDDLGYNFLHPAMLVDETLVSHAGVSRDFVLPFMDNDPEWFMTKLEELFEDKRWNHPLFRAIGTARGGNSTCGGLLWCDFDDEFVPTNFPQVVGHTPRGLRMKGNALCIDQGCKDPNTTPIIVRLV